MKISIQSIICIFYILLTVGACEFGNINRDPNRVEGAVVQNQNLLPTLHYQIGRVFGRYIPTRIGNIVGYTIYKQGPTGFNTYVFSPADGSNINMWADIYSTVINQANIILEKSSATSNPYYAGIAKICLSYSIIQATTIWGDVPFTQTSRANEFPAPVFDTQQSIYARVQSLLDEAISDLSKPAPILPPASDDVIFKGDVSKWIKVAYALKARYYLHLVKVDPTAYDKANAALENALQSNSDNAVIPFEEGVPDLNAPLSLERNSGDTDIDPNFGTLLRTTLKDPREKFFAVVRSSLLTGTRALHGPFYASPNSYYPLITYEECAFMKAEIALVKLDISKAELEFKKAIEASLMRVCKTTIGSTATGDLAEAIPDSILNQYITSKGTLSGSNLDASWKNLFQQKYIALYLQAEAWNDYRRTEKYIASEKGLPVIKIRIGNELPRRLYYSSVELNGNTNAPPNISDVFQRIWWDVP